jgi:hypothetical protein
MSNAIFKIEVLFSCKDIITIIFKTLKVYGKTKFPRNLGVNSPNPSAVLGVGPPKKLKPQRGWVSMPQNQVFLGGR